MLLDAAGCSFGPAHIADVVPGAVPERVVAAAHHVGRQRGRRHRGQPALTVNPQQQQIGCLRSQSSSSASSAAASATSGRGRHLRPPSGSGGPPSITIGVCSVAAAVITADVDPVAPLQVAPVSGPVLLFAVEVQPLHVVDGRIESSRSRLRGVRIRLSRRLQGQGPAALPATHRPESVSHLLLCLHFLVGIDRSRG